MKNIILFSILLLLFSCENKELKPDGTAVNSTPQPTTTTSSTGKGYTKTASELNLQMVFVQGGTFTMGSNTGESDEQPTRRDEQPTHSVTLSSFSIGKFEITQAQWQAVMGSNPSYFSNCSNCPVEQVSWDDVQQFMSELNQLTGKRYRLPTEAEWEYAARGGAQSNNYIYAGSNSIDDVAWSNRYSSNTTHPVGQKTANELGLYDMSGNVWEMCNDWYKGYPGSYGLTDYTGSYRVCRGGSWDNAFSRCRTAGRYYGTFNGRFNNALGFRVVSPR